MICNYFIIWLALFVLQFDVTVKHGLWRAYWLLHELGWFCSLKFKLQSLYNCGKLYQMGRIYVYMCEDFKEALYLFSLAYKWLFGDSLTFLSLFFSFLPLSFFLSFLPPYPFSSISCSLFVPLSSSSSHFFPSPTLRLPTAPCLSVSIKVWKTCEPS